MSRSRAFGVPFSATTEDILMAMRYLYYVKHAPVVSDQDYDREERVFLDRNPSHDSPIRRPGSDREGDYCERYRDLAANISKWPDELKKGQVKQETSGDRK